MKGLALVIGINNYTDARTLANADYDAESISTALQNLKFDVITKLDINYSDFASILDDYYNSLNQYDVALFYFAGHGVEIDGNNYLLAANTPIEKKTSVTMLSAKLQDIITQMHASGCRTNILILDCCRNNPFHSDRAHGTTNLAPVYAPQGTIIAYSTSPGEIAKDGGMGKNSIYTGAILEHINELCLPVEEFFKKVRTTVYNLTGGTQTSWEHTSLIGEFSFNSGQLIHSLEIPYSIDVVKDMDFNPSNHKYGDIIKGFKSYNYYAQQNSLALFKKLDVKELDKNFLFIVGRNILQSAFGGCWDCQHFIDDVSLLRKYTVDGENHLLNGILFEVYFDSHSNYRFNNFKCHNNDLLISGCFDDDLKCSFDFINKLLLPFNLLFKPSSNPQVVSIETFVVLESVTKPFSDGSEEYYIIESLKYQNRELITSINMTNDKIVTYDTIDQFKESVAEYFSIPLKYFSLIFNIQNIDKPLLLRQAFI